MTRAFAMRLILSTGLIVVLSACGGEGIFQEPASHGHALCQDAPGAGEAWQLGCTTRRNIAALAEKPGDLLRPRSETPRDAMRRDSVLGSYFQSQAKTAPQSSTAAAGISSAEGKP